MADITDHVLVENVLDQFGIRETDENSAPILYGENNDLVNTGDGEGRIRIAKNGPDILVRSIRAGANISIIEVDDSPSNPQAGVIEISSTGGAGGGVVGPDPSELNSVALWNSTDGTVLTDSRMRLFTVPIENRVFVQARDPDATSGDLWINWLEIEAPGGTDTHIHIGDGTSRSGAGLPLLLCGTTDGPFYNNVTNKILHELAVDWSIAHGRLFASQDTTEVIELESLGVQGNALHLYTGARPDPNGAVTGTVGDLYVSAAPGAVAVWQNTDGGTTWVAGSTTEGDVVGPGTSTDRAIPTFDGATGDLLRDNPNWVIDALDTLQGGQANFTAGTITAPPILFETEGTNGAQSGIYVLDTSPIGLLSAPPGSFCIEVSGTSSHLYQHRGASANNVDWAPAGTVTGPAGTTANALARYDGTSGNIIKSSGWLLPDTGAMLASGTLELYQAEPSTGLLKLRTTNGTTGAEVSFRVGRFPPVGTITGEPGSFYTEVNGTVSKLWQHRGSAPSDTGWVLIDIGGGDVVGPGTSTDRAIPTFDGTTGDLLQNNLGWIIDVAGQLNGNRLALSQSADTVYLLRLTTTSNGATINLLAGNRDPSGVVSADPGSVYYRGNGTNSRTYQHRGSVTGTSGWVEHGDVQAPPSSTTRAIPTFADTTGRALLNNAPWGITSGGELQGGTAQLARSIDTSELLRLVTTTNGAVIPVYAGNRHPEGNVSAAPGSIYIRGATSLSRLFQHRGTSTGATGWVEQGNVIGTASSVANRLITFLDTTGKALRSHSLWEIDANGVLRNGKIITNQTADTDYAIRLLSVGTNGGIVELYSGNRDPEGVVDANPGSMYYRNTGLTSEAYVRKGSGYANTGWVALVDRTDVPTLRQSRATRTTGPIAISSGGNNHIAAPTTEYNDGSHYTTFNSRWTCPADGIYSFWATVAIATAAPGSVELRFFKNSTSGTMIGNTGSTAQEPTTHYLNLSVPAIRLDSGDYVELWAQQTTGLTATAIEDSISIGCAQLRGV